MKWAAVEAAVEYFSEEKTAAALASAAMARPFHAVMILSSRWGFGRVARWVRRVLVDVVREAAISFSVRSKAVARVASGRARKRVFWPSSSPWGSLSGREFPSACTP